MQRLCTALIVGTGIQSHDATRSFKHSPYALLLLVVQHQVFVPMNPKSIAAGPREKESCQGKARRWFRFHL